MLGNKGGLAIRMTVFDSNCCFVGCHFHASANAVAARNMDYTKIVTSSSFPPQSDGPETLSITTTTTTTPTTTAATTTTTTTTTWVSFANLGFIIYVCFDSFCICTYVVEGLCA